MKKAGELSQQRRFQQLHRQYQQKREPMSTKQRLIHVDYSVFNDEDLGSLSEVAGTSGISKNVSSGIVNKENAGVVHRRKKDDHKCNEMCDPGLESYDLANENDQRRGCSRRHTIVGCHGKLGESQSTPTSRPESRQSEFSTTVTMNPLNPLNPMNASTYSTTEIIDIDEPEEECAKEAIDKQWQETISVSDRLALTLEEIVHIRSVMTKAELEGLPVGVRIKEDVERRKVCFLCLRTRFTIFGQWGVQCKLCHRTVCNRCYSRMRIPTEHFRNVPVVLLSPSLMSSPMTSSAPSPSHHAYNMRNASGPSTMMDDGFPKTLMEKLLLKTESPAKLTPSSPRINHSTSSTPGHKCGPSNTLMTKSVGGITAEEVILSSNNSNRSSIMSRSMEGPRSLPPQSPARPHSNNSTLDRRNRFGNAFTLSGNPDFDPRHPMKGEMMAVCNDCRGLVFEIIRSTKQTRSMARNKALRNLSLDLSPVYKR